MGTILQHGGWSRYRNESQGYSLVLAFEIRDQTIAVSNFGRRDRRNFFPRVNFLCISFSNRTVYKSTYYVGSPDPLLALSLHVDGPHSCLQVTLHFGHVVTNVKEVIVTRDVSDIT